MRRDVADAVTCSRFLRGAKGNVGRAVAMFQAHLEWRVRYKLDGRDACRLQSLHSEGGGAEPARPLERGSGLSVADHVERVIQEATSLDNLASMYEGWTPWI